MGSPEFAAPSLEALLQDPQHEITAIFTRPPKPSGRGKKLTNTPIHELALKHNMPVHTPTSLRDINTARHIKEIEADIIIVVAYGMIIPEEIIDCKKYGCLNIHPSKLPRHRGAAPLQHTIISGDTESAICIMQMDAGLDTGDILLSEKIDLPEDITFGELHDLCATKGAKLLIDTLKQIDTLQAQAQSSIGVTYAHKITKEHAEINWDKTGKEIDCLVRGLNPFPGAFFIHKNKVLKVYKIKYKQQEHSYKYGEIINDDFEIACRDGIIQPQLVKPEGKKTMHIQDFLRGQGYKF